MFCTTLRRRASTATLVPFLTAAAPKGLALVERDLQTYDISLPLPHHAVVAPSTSNTSIPFPVQGRHQNLIALLLTPSSVNSDALPNTLDRIQHFSSLNGGASNSVVFFIIEPTTSPDVARKPYTTTNNDINQQQQGKHPEAQDGINAYNKLQQCLLFPATAPVSSPSPNAYFTIPVIPIHSAQNIPQTVQTYKSSLLLPSAHRITPIPPSKEAYDLLPFCTTDYQLSAEESIAVSDAFVSIKDLVTVGAAAVISNSNSVFTLEGREEPEKEEAMDDGFARLVTALGMERAVAVREFWREEWVAE